MYNSRRLALYHYWVAFAVFFPAAEYKVTTRITEVVGHHFKTEGKVLVEPGWLQVYGKETSGEDANLVPVQKDEKVKTDKIAAQQLVTKPPARYNEATLLSAMEGAGKLIDDDELREAISEKGLGTPATRAQIIEGLILEKYMLREGRDLIPTAKAFQLITLLRGLDVEDLTRPELTGNWEFQLASLDADYPKSTALGGFDAGYMQQLFDYGYQRGRSGVLWQSAPAGLTPPPVPTPPRVAKR